jgi:mannonate dehydratase
MLIRATQVIVTSPGRNFVTLKVSTDDGVTGLGDATRSSPPGSRMSLLTCLSAG